MRFSPFKTTARKLLLPLALLLPLSGCLTPTTGQAINADLGVASRVCSVWLNESYDSQKDTPQTVNEVRGNNRARTAYCAGVPATAK
jgi:hypothetical protein